MLKIVGLPSVDAVHRGLTPNTNQGVNLSKIKDGQMSTKLTGGKSYKVDWLAFTKKSTFENSMITIRKILDYLGYDLENFSDTSPRYFYNKGLTIGNYVNIYYNVPTKDLSDKAQRSVCFQFTGVGTTDLADHLETIYDSDNREQNWITFWRWLISMKCKITRCDLALDDFIGEVDFDLAIHKLEHNCFRSVKKSFSINRGAMRNGKLSGLTIYIGQNTKTSKGTYFLRMYKKLAEFESKGQLPPEIARKTGVWDRYEIAFTKEKARNVIAKIIEAGNFGEVYFGVLRKLVEFLNPKRNKNGKVYSNKDYWPVCDWWENFLQGAKAVSVGSDDIRTIELADLLKFIRVQVVPSLRLLEQLGKHTDPKFDIYHLIKLCEVDEFSKKQTRLYNNALSMPPELLKLYLKQFVEGF